MEVRCASAGSERKQGEGGGRALGADVRCGCEVWLCWRCVKGVDDRCESDGVGWEVLK